MFGDLEVKAGAGQRREGPVGPAPAQCPWTAVADGDFDSNEFHSHELVGDVPRNSFSGARWPEIRF